MTARCQQRLTKRQQRLAEKTTERGVEKFPAIGQLNFNLRHINPITDNQVLAFNAYEDGENMCLLGCAGTGKSFLSIYNALKDVSDKTSPYRKVVLIRTAQASKDIGFLPGTEKQKLEVYEAPFKAICSDLYKRGDAYEVLKQKGILEFHGTSFLRGTTIDSAVVVIDEIQNMRWQEIRTILTRIGTDCRVIICGDVRQDDLTSARYKEETGIITMVKVLKKMGLNIIEFGVEDIVRSGFVKSFIEAEYALGLY